MAHNSTKTAGLCWVGNKPQLSGCDSCHKKGRNTMFEYQCQVANVQGGYSGGNNWLRPRSECPRGVAVATTGLDREANVQGSLVSVEPGILHGQYIGRRACFIVMRVPAQDEKWRRSESQPGNLSEKRGCQHVTMSENLINPINVYT